MSNLRFGENSTITKSNPLGSSAEEEEEFKNAAVIVDSGQTFAQLLLNTTKSLFLLLHTEICVIFIDYSLHLNISVLTSRLTSNGPLELQVDRSVEYQKITGFGGAVTGTVSYLLELLDQQLQDHIFKYALVN